jgi:hypothetical protein
MRINMPWPPLIFAGGLLWVFMTCDA